MYAEECSLSKANEFILRFDHLKEYSNPGFDKCPVDSIGMQSESKTAEQESDINNQYKTDVSHYTGVSNLNPDVDGPLTDFESSEQQTESVIALSERRANTVIKKQINRERVGNPMVRMETVDEKRQPLAQNAIQKQTTIKVEPSGALPEQSTNLPKNQELNPPLPDPPSSTPDPFHQHPPHQNTNQADPTTAQQVPTRAPVELKLIQGPPKPQQTTPEPAQAPPTSAQMPPPSQSFEPVLTHPPQSLQPVVASAPPPSSLNDPAPPRVQQPSNNAGPSSRSIPQQAQTTQPNYPRTYTPGVQPPHARTAPTYPAPPLTNNFTSPPMQMVSQDSNGTSGANQQPMPVQDFSQNPPLRPHNYPTQPPQHSAFPPPGSSAMPGQPSLGPPPPQLPAIQKSAFEQLGASFTLSTRPEQDNHLKKATSAMGGQLGASVAIVSCDERSFSNIMIPNHIQNPEPPRQEVPEGQNKPNKKKKRRPKHDSAQHKRGTSQSMTRSNKDASPRLQPSQGELKAPELNPDRSLAQPQEQVPPPISPSPARVTSGKAPAGFIAPQSVAPPNHLKTSLFQPIQPPSSLPSNQLPSQPKKIPSLQPEKAIEAHSEEAIREEPENFQTPLPCDTPKMNALKASFTMNINPITIPRQSIPQGEPLVQQEEEKAEAQIAQDNGSSPSQPRQEIEETKPTGSSESPVKFNAAMFVSGYIPPQKPVQCMTKSVSKEGELSSPSTAGVQKEEPKEQKNPLEVDCEVESKPSIVKHTSSQSPASAFMSSQIDKPINLASSQAPAQKQESPKKLEGSSAQMSQSSMRSQIQTKMVQQFMKMSISMPVIKKPAPKPKEPSPPRYQEPEEDEPLIQSVDENEELPQEQNEEQVAPASKEADEDPLTFQPKKQPSSPGFGREEDAAEEKALEDKFSGFDEVIADPNMNVQGDPKREENAENPAPPEGQSQHSFHESTRTEVPQVNLPDLGLALDPSVLSNEYQTLTKFYNWFNQGGVAQSDDIISQLVFFINELALTKMDEETAYSEVFYTYKGWEQYPRDHIQAWLNQHVMTKISEQETEMKNAALQCEYEIPQLNERLQTLNQTIYEQRNKRRNSFIGKPRSSYSGLSNNAGANFHPNFVPEAQNQQHQQQPPPQHPSYQPQQQQVPQAWPQLSYNQNSQPPPNQFNQTNYNQYPSTQNEGQQQEQQPGQFAQAQNPSWHQQPPQQQQPEQQQYEQPTQQYQQYQQQPPQQNQQQPSHQPSSQHQQYQQSPQQQQQPNENPFQQPPSQMAMSPQEENSPFHMPTEAAQPPRPQSNLSKGEINFVDNLQASLDDSFKKDMPIVHESHIQESNIIDSNSSPFDLPTEEVKPDFLPEPKLSVSSKHFDINQLSESEIEHQKRAMEKFTTSEENRIAMNSAMQPPPLVPLAQPKQEAICSTCLSEVSPGQLAEPFCQHSYCKNCLGQYVMETMNTGSQCKECQTPIPARLKQQAINDIMNL